ncbi:HDOD domain-containing protein [Candidatus Sumerlaeota bacterium]|nr:HDOD domain-containing protein [Candidatus Sumerlaeota bacterium]
MKRRVIFVDDDRNVLNGLRRMLRSMREEWEMVYASGGQQALDLLAVEPCDVVVTDMRMPGMDGGELLKRVKKEYPRAARIVLTGFTEQEATLRTVGLTHQFLSKPCDPDMLKTAIQRACALRELLADETLSRLVLQVESLPSMPQLYTRIVEELNSPDSSIKNVGRIIESDLGMASKILQLVNSAFFGMPRHISNIPQAVQLLGMETIKSLVLTVHIFSNSTLEQLPGFSLEQMQAHSMYVGVAARQIATTESDEKRLGDAAFLAGIVHDIGKLVLASQNPEQYAQVLLAVQNEGLSYWEAEMKIIGTSHASIGAYLMSVWGLGDDIIEALAYHHTPSDSVSEKFNPLTAVHAANGLMKLNGALPAPDVLPAHELDFAYFKRLGMTDRLSPWAQFCPEAGANDALEHEAKNRAL